MTITLIRTGGIIPMTKKAEKDVDWTPDELRELIRLIKNKDEGPGDARDGSGYHLMYNGEIFSIDWDKIPKKYKKTFEDLKNNLKIEKR